MRLAFTGIHSASAWGVQDTGGRGCCPCGLGSPAGRTAVERTAVERSFPRVTQVTYFHAINLEPQFFVGEELEGSHLNGTHQLPWKPHSVNHKALKFKSSHPLRPSGCRGLSRQTSGRGRCDRGWRSKSVCTGTCETVAE